MLQDFTTPARALGPGIFYEFSSLLEHVEICRRDPTTDERMTEDQIKKIDLSSIPEAPRTISTTDVAKALMDVCHLVKDRLDSYFYKELIQNAFKVSLTNFLIC